MSVWVSNITDHWSLFPSDQPSATPALPPGSASPPEGTASMMDRSEPGGPHAIPRRHAPIEQLVRQGSFRGFPALSQKNSPFKRQLSLRLNDLPSTLQRKTDFETKNPGEWRHFGSHMLTNADTCWYFYLIKILFHGLRFYIWKLLISKIGTRMGCHLSLLRVYKIIKAPKGHIEIKVSFYADDLLIYLFFLWQKPRFLYHLCCLHWLHFRVHIYFAH